MVKVKLPKQTCRGPLVEPVTRERLRMGCGEDLTELVRAIPGDGEDHQIQCVVCGNVVTCMRKDPEE